MLSLGPTPGLWICSSSLNMPRCHISAGAAHSVWEALLILANPWPPFKAHLKHYLAPRQALPSLQLQPQQTRPQKVPVVEGTQVPLSSGRDRVSLKFGPLHLTLNLGHERPGIGTKIASQRPPTLRHYANSPASVVSQACRSAEITVIMVIAAPNVYGALTMSHALPRGHSICYLLSSLWHSSKGITIINPVTQGNQA